VAKVKKIKRCYCKGKISKCNHELHSHMFMFGSMVDMSGRVIESWADAAFSCTGCSFPVYPIKPVEYSLP